MIDTYQPGSAGRNLERGIPCINSTGEDMPPHAVFMINEIDASGVVVAKKPDEDGASAVLFGPTHTVPDGATFFAVSPYDELAAYTDADALTPGDTIGTESGSWEMSSDQSGFVAIYGLGGAVRCRPFRPLQTHSASVTFLGNDDWNDVINGWEDGHVVSSDWQYPRVNISAGFKKLGIRTTVYHEHECRPVLTSAGAGPYATPPIAYVRPTDFSTAKFSTVYYQIYMDVEYTDNTGVTTSATELQRQEGAEGGNLTLGDANNAPFGYLDNRGLNTLTFPIMYGETVTIDRIMFRVVYNLSLSATPEYTTTMYARDDVNLVVGRISDSYGNPFFFPDF